MHVILCTQKPPSVHVTCTLITRRTICQALKTFNQKHDSYLPLAAELNCIYDKFTFKIIPITIGVTGLVTNDLKLILKQTGLENINNVILKCQKSPLLGTLKIIKSFMKM